MMMMMMMIIIIIIIIINIFQANCYLKVKSIKTN